ncbi:hypothetical protein LVJ82_02965 [Vitreoscilla massiliensis]|uniref:Uncharacterized protein n=1 Tax=Vitreoscilla massiliensis TaxID=1689272 RepID=A0ABY4E2F8_9NEIS|nr:hypothetical protein [Vitreoscilla massiliensis]UOO89963.1 hypothetical protein LVJ82_02965 [Vitreoscilla massiliensis]
MQWFKTVVVASVLGSSALVQAQTWQVCTWDVEVTRTAKPWQNVDVVTQTKFNSGEIAAMEVDNERRGWELTGRFLRTNGPYTEPCAYANGTSQRMVVWPSYEHADKMPPQDLLFQAGDVLTVTQYVTEADVDKRQLSSDEFELQAVQLNSDVYSRELP